MIKFTDKANIGTTKETSEGHVIAYARALRTGVQDYMASELGLVGNHTVKVYRPPESVFDANSLQSLSHATVTIDHPAEMVDADNWKELAVGEVSTEVMRDGDFVAVPLILKDKAAIDAVKNGKSELSAGYVADMMPAPEGSEYDFIMGPPKYNHIAIVDTARAGSKARIGDNAINWGATPLTKQKGKTMEFVKIMFGDKAINVADKDADALNNLLKDHATVVADKDTVIGELKAKLADAEAKVLTDAAIDELVAAKVEAKSKRDAVAAKFGDAAIEGATDAEIAGMFKVIDAAKSTDPVREIMKDAKPQAKKGAWEGIYKKKGDK